MRFNRFVSGIVPAAVFAALVSFAAPLSSYAQDATPSPAPSAPTMAASPAAACACDGRLSRGGCARDGRLTGRRGFAGRCRNAGRRGARRPPPNRLRPRCPLAPLGSAAVAETDKYAAVPAVPAVMTNCTPSGGDTAWMLTSVALVLMMTIPGLGLFYGGMVRKKNVGDTVMTSFAITALVTVLYAVVTYSLSFTLRGMVHRRVKSSVPPEHSQRRQQRRHWQSQSAGADDPRDRLHVLPDDLRDHHPGADRRRLRGAHEVLGDAVVHHACG